LKALFIGALAATLAGCTRQPPPQVATESCPATNGFACFERTTTMRPIELASFGIESRATEAKSAIARKAGSLPVPARHKSRLAGKTTTPATIAAKAGLASSHVPLPPASPKMRRQPTDNVAAAATDATLAKIAEPHLTVGVANSRSVEAQVAAATSLAERMTPVTATAAADIRADDRDRSAGDAEKTKPSPNDTDLLVAILMAHSDVRSVSELAGKTIAIDDRYFASNSSVRTAIVAAGAPEVRVSEGPTTAINRLVSGEVPAAVLALVSADAATGFPEIAGFKIFHVPLSPRALKPRP
jgi:hypothetical protein